jgi:hypothetical protein
MYLFSSLKAEFCPHLMLQGIDDMGSSWHTAGDGDIADHPVVEAAAV